MPKLSPTRVFVALILATAPAHAAGPNPILGSWALSASSPVPGYPGIVCAITGMTFTVTKEFQTNEGGGTVAYPVDYLASAQMVIVLSGGNYKRFQIHGSTEIYYSDQQPVCTYRRASAEEAASGNFINTAPQTTVSAPPPIPSYDDAINAIDEAAKQASPHGSTTEDANAAIEEIKSGKKHVMTYDEAIKAINETK